jgi:hypothetical protein
MRRFGLSAAVVVALAAPAWSQYPAPGSVPLGPTPGGFPTTALSPNGFPAQPASLTPPGGFSAPGGAPGACAPPGNPCDPCATAPGACPPGAGADPCGYAFDPCYPKDRLGRTRVQHESWLRADWLYWRFRDMPLPVLVATGDPSRPDAALPGLGNIVPLVGPRDLGTFNGVRLTYGQWLDPEGELGVELSGFVFERRGTAAFLTSSAALPVLSVPLLGADGVPATFDAAFPGDFAGSLGVRTATHLWGAEASLLHRRRGDGCVSVDTLFGYRHLQLNERVELLGRAQTLGPGGRFTGLPLPAGTTVLTTDSFRAGNEFHGAQLGARVEARRDMFTLVVFGKGGAGVNLQTLRVDGNTRVTGFGFDRTAFGGVLALPSNFGYDTNTDFSLVGETGVEFGLQVTKNLALRVGYNLLFWSDVLRPGNVIDPVVNLTQVPTSRSFGTVGGPARPVTVFRSSDFLAHGLVVGVTLDW